MLLISKPDITQSSRTPDGKSTWGGREPTGPRAKLPTILSRHVPLHILQCSAPSSL